VNFDSLNDHALKVRERDFMQQARISIGTLQGCLAERLAGC
jgi:glycyl-tRNA synthetase (class II)